MATPHHTTAPGDRLSVFQKLVYGLGAFANNLLGTATGSLMIALNLGLGMDPAKIGLLGAIPRITDALTDPVMGYISDHTRTRWGRRRPYIFLGSIFCGILFTLLWAFPSDASETFVFWYFMIGSIIFYMGYTVWVTPWVALGYELTPDYHERTRVMGYSNFLGQTAFLLTPWFLWFMQLKAFGNILRGATWLALAISLVVVVCCVISAIFLRERFVEAQAEKDRQDLARNAPPKETLSLQATIADFFKGFWTSLKFRPFLKLCATAFLVFNGFMLVASFTIYVWIYYVCAGDKELGGKIAGVAGSLSGVAAFVIVIIVTKLGTHLGKRRAFLVCTTIAIIGYLSKFFLFTPAHPWLSVIPGLFIAFGFGSMFPLVGSMIADVCDLDELQTHERREGMYGSIFWWVIKVGMAAALAMSGILLNVTGFDVALPLQSESTLFLIRILDAGIPALTSLLAIWIIYTFEITEAKAYEVRAELERRKGQAVPAGSQQSEQRI